MLIGDQLRSNGFDVWLALTEHQMRVARGKTTPHREHYYSVTMTHGNDPYAVDEEYKTLRDALRHYLVLVKLCAYGCASEEAASEYIA
jgi:hypothetical protein